MPDICLLSSEILPPSTHGLNSHPSPRPFLRSVWLSIELVAQTMQYLGAPQRRCDPATSNCATA